MTTTRLRLCIPIQSSSPQCFRPWKGIPNSPGRQFLLALILGYEVGTRIGLALHGPEMLSRGWHSGVVFGLRSGGRSGR